MSWSVASVLALIWLIGMATGHTMGYLIHILLVIAAIVILINIIQGRKPI